MTNNIVLVTGSNGCWETTFINGSNRYWYCSWYQW